MGKTTALLLGAGGRGFYAYAPYADKYPHELQFVGVAEPKKELREAFALQYGVPSERCYESWEDALNQARMADVILICTQDRMHYAPTLRALELGYHVLLEKPMSPQPLECIEMELAAKKADRLLTICHVLRYTSFWTALKQVIAEGRIGEVTQIQLNENVGFYHMAHSFVRGNWRKKADSSPMILAKSCHDMDIISWLMDRECLRVSSFGSLMHFNSRNAPEGSADRCTDGCAVEHECPYSAPRFYLNDTGWARFFTTDTSREGILRELQEGPYGRCVYQCDNDVVDHQVVNMEFEGGATAMFSMCGFTRDISRSIQVMGTRGEIRGMMEESKLSVFDFATKNEMQIHVHTGEEGHGGGDEGIVRSFLQDVRGYTDRKGNNLTSAEASVRSHLMAFAAEESRLHQGMPVDIRDYRSRLLQNG